MSRLVDELKKEHAVMVSRLDEVRKNMGTRAALDTLILVKKGLLAHLKKEDDKLYPILNDAAASGDTKVASILKTFASDMEKISAAAIAFFDKYTGDNEGILGPGFAKEFENLYKTLAERIASEEMILYPAFARLEAKWNVAVESNDAAAMPAAAASQRSPGSMSPIIYSVAGLALLIAAIALLKIF